jgi:hypothetical protein
MGGDPMEICPKCIEIGLLGDLNGEAHIRRRGNNSTPLKHRFSAVKHYSKGVYLISTKEFLPHFREKGKRRGEIAKGG